MRPASNAPRKSNSRMSQGSLLCATRVVLAQPASAMQQPNNRPGTSDLFMTSAPHGTPTTSNTIGTRRLAPGLLPGPWHQERLCSEAGMAAGGKVTMTAEEPSTWMHLGETHPTGCARRRKRPRCFPCKRCSGESSCTGAVTLRDDRLIVGQTNRYVDLLWQEALIGEISRGEPVISHGAPGPKDRPRRPSQPRTPRGFLCQAPSRPQGPRTTYRSA